MRQPSIKINRIDTSKFIRKSKHIVSYYNYDIYDDGRIFAYGHFNRFLEPEITKWGYERIVLTSEKLHTSRIMIHRLVALAFIPNPNNYLTVNHLNGIRNDNRVENLEWATMKRQSNHRWQELNPEHLCYQQIMCVADGIQFSSIKKAMLYFKPQKKDKKIGGIEYQHYVRNGRLIILNNSCQAYKFQEEWNAKKHLYYEDVTGRWMPLKRNMKGDDK